VITLEKSKEDIKLDKIGKLLELGGTMLANHCECGVPLFRYHGNVICPICDSNSKGAIESQKKIEKDNTKPAENSSLTSSKAEQNIQNVKTSEKTTPLHGNNHSNQSQQSFTKVPQPFTEPQEVTSKPIATTSSISPETYEFINNTIINKVVQLCLDLQRETDHGRIKKQIEAIESGTRALKNLR
jgi:UPF0148 protein